MVTLMFVSVNAGKDRNEGENLIVRVHPRLVCEEPPRIDYPLGFIDSVRNPVLPSVVLCAK
jgi:hypothetical protein